jgi:hypothetical protein
MGVACRREGRPSSAAAALSSLGPVAVDSTLVVVTVSGACAGSAVVELRGELSLQPARSSMLARVRAAMGRFRRDRPWAMRRIIGLWSSLVNNSHQRRTRPLARPWNPYARPIAGGPDRAVIELTHRLRDAGLDEAAQRLEHAYEMEAKIVALIVSELEAVLSAIGGLVSRRTRRAKADADTYDTCSCGAMSGDIDAGRFGS